MNDDLITLLFAGRIENGTPFSGTFVIDPVEDVISELPGLTAYRADGTFTFLGQNYASADNSVQIADNESFAAVGVEEADVLRLSGAFRAAPADVVTFQHRLVSTSTEIFDGPRLTSELTLDAFDLANTGTLISFATGPGLEFTEFTALSSSGVDRPEPEPEPDGLTREEAIQVALVYEAALDRDGVIDLPGLNFWIDAREGRLPSQVEAGLPGLTPAELGDAFVASNEFAALFGDPEELTDRQFVETLYRNVLDREGDAGGIDFWTGVAAREEVSRGAVLVEFAVSVENAATLAFVETIEETDGVWSFGG